MVIKKGMINLVQSLALVSLDDLLCFVAKQSIKNEVWNSKQAADYLGCSVAQIKNKLLRVKYQELS